MSYNIVRPERGKARSGSVSGVDPEQGDRQAGRTLTPSMAASAVPRYRMICSTAVNTSSHPTLSQNSIAAAHPAWSDVFLCSRASLLRPRKRTQREKEGLHLTYRVPYSNREAVGSSSSSPFIPRLCWECEPTKDVRSQFSSSRRREMYLHVMHATASDAAGRARIGIAHMAPVPVGPRQYLWPLVT